MTEEYSNVTEGQIIQFSEGSYSDYHIVGTFKVLKPFNIKDESNEYLAVDLGSCQLKFPTKTVTLENQHETSAFLARLTEKGLIEDFEVAEFHCGDYRFTGVSYN